MHLNSDRNQLHQMMYLFVLASIISITITGLFAYYFSKRITAPLGEMNRRCRPAHIACGHNSIGVQAAGHDPVRMA
jgi:thiosulfate reductase cytochrome b subunit